MKSTSHSGLYIVLSLVLFSISSVSVLGGINVPPNPTVNVIINGLDETKEEFPGAFVEYVPDDLDGLITWEGVTKFAGVSIICSPQQPSSAMVSVDAPSGFLYEKVGEEYIPAQSLYPANEIGNKKFFLHGHITSASLIDEKIAATLINSQASDFANFTVFEVKNMGIKNGRIKKMLPWPSTGVNSTIQYIQPDPGELGATWSFNGLPDDTSTKVVWNPSLTDNPKIGIGASPSLSIKYESNNPEFSDFLPPNNDWFGEKEVVVTIGDMIGCELTIQVKLKLFFKGRDTRTNLLTGEEQYAWNYYYRKNLASPDLLGFIYDHYMEDRGRFNPLTGNLLIGKTANDGVLKSVFTFTTITSPGSYSEVPYTPIWYGVGCHAVSKICVHEIWHKLLFNEVGFTHTGDSDWDGISDYRELLFGSDPTNKDSTNLAAFMDGSYSKYASYADEELFCRWAEIGKLGVAGLDWAYSGAQVP